MSQFILIIEDNPNAAEGLRQNLEFEGYRIQVAVDGAKGLLSVEQNKPDLVILDLSLPCMDGLQVLRMIRKRGLLMPVLILTARNEEVDKVRGFRLGADQYLNKPFGVLELLARVESLLNRAQPPASASRVPKLRFGNVIIDTETREVSKNNVRVALAPKEYDLLIALWEKAGAILTRQELIRDVWGYADQVLTRTVDTHIGELRRKLEPNPVKPRFILTVRKVGYRLQRRDTHLQDGL